MEFEWDPEKSESNLKLHGGSFQEAATVFDDALSSTVPDPTIRLMKHPMSLSAFPTKAGH